MRLEQWSIGVRPGNPYIPPECRLALHGRVYSHPDFDKGEEITTSVIAKVNGREVHTISGSIYQLGEISERYLNWCQAHYGPNWEFDPENPIKEKTQ